jgi:lauroyl/myristoyl acyltransferase
MTSTKQNQVTWHHEQTDRLPLVSPGDVTYVLAALFLSGMQMLPASQRVRVVTRVSPLLGWLLHTLNVHSTEKTRQNMNVLLGADRSPDAVEVDLRRLLSLIVWNALMINSLPVLSREQIAHLVPIDGISCLDDCLDDGRPVLIWSCHFGVHPLIIAAMLHALDYPIHAVTHVRHMPVAASAFQRRYLQRLARIGDQFPVIDPREGVQRAMLDVLRNGECLYITPDYMVTTNETQSQSAFLAPIDFLNRRAFLQTGGLRLAKRLKAHVVTVFSNQLDGDERRLVVEPFELPTSGLTPDELRRDMQACMQCLEAHVLVHPYLWWDLKRTDLLERLRAIPTAG